MKIIDILNQKANEILEGKFKYLRGFYEYKKRKYYKQRAKNWEEFKKQNGQHLKCGLVKKDKELGYYPSLWEYDCRHKWCYEKEFFEKYGCIYVKGFIQE